jgi:hypothetical protein
MACGEPAIYALSKWAPSLRFNINDLEHSFRSATVVPRVKRSEPGVFAKEHGWIDGDTGVCRSFIACCNSVLHSRYAVLDAPATSDLYQRTYIRLYQFLFSCVSMAQQVRTPAEWRAPDRQA